MTPTRRALTLIALLAALPAVAGPVSLLTADQFEARVTGRTLYWTRGAEDYGAEQYLPDRRVIWRLHESGCKQGQWYAQGAHICFVYEDSAEPICWTFAEAQGGLVARPMGGGPGAVLRAGAETTLPLNCGAEVGV